jgi:hypothetical protein
MALRSCAVLRGVFTVLAPASSRASRFHPVSSTADARSRPRLGIGERVKFHLELRVPERVLRVAGRIIYMFAQLAVVAQAHGDNVSNRLRVARAQRRSRAVRRRLPCMLSNAKARPRATAATTRRRHQRCSQRALFSVIKIEVADEAVGERRPVRWRPMRRADQRRTALGGKALCHPPRDHARFRVQRSGRTPDRIRRLTSCTTASGSRSNSSPTAYSARRCASVGIASSGSRT